MDIDYNDALRSGKVKLLRLATLDDEGNIIVTSVDHEFTDDYFRDVGICSYTWGHGRIDWYDRETGLTWKVSDRAVEMCKETLKYFSRVWIDGLCMVQAWPSHIKDNMAVMGKIYYHGTVVPEMIIGLKPEYCYRGWVQQEISFTKLLVVIKPLKDFLQSSHGEDELLFVQKNADEFANVKDKNLNLLQGRLENSERILQLFGVCLDYLLGLQRIFQGRKDDPDLAEKCELLYMDLEPDNLDFHVYKGEDEERELKSIHWIYYLFNKLINTVPIPMRLSREARVEDVVLGALTSYRSGFFRFNSDRVTAALSLAAYVLDKKDQELMDYMDIYRPKTFPQADIVIANPGKWCTGIRPRFRMKTIRFEEICSELLAYHVDRNKEPFLFDMNFGLDFSDRQPLDKFFSIIHSCDEAVLQEYEYVLGYHKADQFMYCLYLGLRPLTGDGDIRGLIMIRQMQVVTFMVDNDCVGGSAEWIMRATALLNASYHVYCLGADEYRITQSKIDIIREYKTLPKGEYFDGIFAAIRMIAFGFGALINVCSFNKVNGEPLKIQQGMDYNCTDFHIREMMDGIQQNDQYWGGRQWEHLEFGHVEAPIDSEEEEEKNYEKIKYKMEKIDKEILKELKKAPEVEDTVTEITSEPSNTDFASRQLVMEADEGASGMRSTPPANEQTEVKKRKSKLCSIS